MRRLSVVLVLGFVLVTSCRREESPAPPPASAPVEAPVRKPPETFTHLPAHRGVVILSAEAPRLLPCGGGPAIPLKDDTGGALAEAYEALASAETGEMWVQLRGEASEAGLRVAAVDRASPVGEGDPCASLPGPGEFRALGNEPFWAVDVTGAGLSVSEPGQDTVVFPAVEPVRDGERLTWTTELPAADASSRPRQLQLVIGPARCKDGMSGAWHALAAEAVLDGRALAGCAYRGD